MKSVCMSTLALLTVACADPLVDSQQITKPRVIGARVEVVDAPERASPEPGETCSIHWLLAAPAELAISSAVMGVCVAESTARGNPVCASEFIAVTASSSAPFRMTFEVPGVDMLGEAERLAALAIFCETGAPELDANIEDARCSRGDTLRASLDIELSTGNHNPSTQRAEVWLDGVLLPAGSAVDGCAESARVAFDGATHELKLRLGGASREPIPESEPGVAASETLQVSTLSTQGLFERHFSTLPPSDDEVFLDWVAPEGTQASDTAELFFVVRDLRGGTSWLTRRICSNP